MDGLVNCDWDRVQLELQSKVTPSPNHHALEPPHLLALCQHASTSLIIVLLPD